MLLSPLQERSLSGITHSFPWLSPTEGYVTYPLLPRLPLSPLRVLARLACLIHAANVHSEPGSNPSIVYRASSLLAIHHDRFRNRAKQPSGRIVNTKNLIAVFGQSLKFSRINRSQHHSRGANFSAATPADPSRPLRLFTAPAAQNIAAVTALFEAHSNQIVKEHSRPRKVAGPPLSLLRAQCQR